MRSLMDKIIGYSAIGLGVAALLAIFFGIATVINYYLWNFILGIFNTGYELSWVQAIGVTLICGVLKQIFGRSGGRD